jgi:hypothetical protein
MAAERVDLARSIPSPSQFALALTEAGREAVIGPCRSRL